MKFPGGSHPVARGLAVGVLYVASPLQAAVACFESMAVIGPGEPESYGLIMGLVYLLFAIWKRRAQTKARQRRVRQFGATPDNLHKN